MMYWHERAMAAEEVAQHLYEALRSMGEIHCRCPDCQAERSNAMREYEALSAVPKGGLDE
jgi:hypothetical protein